MIIALLEIKFDCILLLVCISMKNFMYIILLVVSMVGVALQGF
jgi:hypothetical protein